MFRIFYRRDILGNFFNPRIDIFSWDGVSRQKASSAFSFINFIILIYQLMRLKNSDGWNRVTKYGAVSGKHGTNDVWFDIDYAGGDCNGCCPTCCH